MADITVRGQGHVDPSGKVNWRGDQVNAPQPQSIYETSSDPLADLGARKVVGDRVFRYAKAGGTFAKGRLLQSMSDDSIINLQIGVTAGGDAITGCNVLTLYASTNLSKNLFAEGYVHVETVGGDVSVGEGGDLYRIKSHASVASGTNGTFYLYDEIAASFSATDVVTMTPNIYLNAVLCTGTDNKMALGVASVACTTGDYFWLQTWGPGPCLIDATSTPTKGELAYVAQTGAVQGLGAKTEARVAVAMYSCTETDSGLFFFRIAP